MSPSTPNLTLPAAPVPPIFGAIQGQRPQRKSQIPTYLGSGSVPKNPGEIQGPISPSQPHTLLGAA